MFSYPGQISNFQVKTDDENIPSHPQDQPGCILHRQSRRMFCVTRQNSSSIRRNQNTFYVSQMCLLITRKLTCNCKILYPTHFIKCVLKHPFPLQCPSALCDVTNELDPVFLQPAAGNSGLV